MTESESENSLIQENIFLSLIQIFLVFCIHFNGKGCIKTVI